MSEPFIRVAKLGDEAGLHEAHMRSIREVCSQAHTPEEISGWGNRPLNDRWSQIIQNGYVWGVEWNGAIKGVAYIRIFSKDGEVRGHVHGLYLTPEVLGKGLGGKLMQLMLETAKQAGASKVTLESSLNAHDFYKRFGFQDTGPMTQSEIGGSLVRGYPMAIDITI